MKNLLIVESPTKVKSIQKFLGNDYKVVASVGHVRDLMSSSRKGIDVENNYSPKWSISKDKKDIINDIKKYSKDADTVYFATDPDREGEAISKHIYDILDKAKLLKGKKAYRVAFNEITENAVTTALENPRQISDNLWNAYLARRTLDYLMGYDITEFLWKKVSRLARGGRVQSPALRLIVEKENEISAFDPVEYWVSSLVACSKDDCIDLDLVSIDGEKIKKGNITSIVNENDANKIKKELNKFKTIKIDNIKTSERKLKPRAPFTTASLQQAAYSTLSFSVKQTSAIAQRLYQGMPLGDKETVGLISYMRTDSTNLSDECLKDISSYLSKNHKEFESKETRKYSKKVKNAQEAHEAIRPTSIFNTPMKVKKYLDDADFKLYELIWKRTVASQMIDATYKQVGIEFILGEKFLYKYSGSFLKDNGFKEIYDLSENDEKEKINKRILDDLKKGDELSIKEINVDQKFTQPPARYNQASLIQALEELGIGRPSTYVTIISKILESNYVDPEASNFQPTALAKVVCDTLTKHFSNDLVDFDFTAKLEDNLDKIANGDQDPMTCIKSTYEPFRVNLEDKLVTVDISETRELKNLGIHPETGRPVTVRLTKYGPTIQMGTKEDEEKPKWAALTYEQKKNIDSITMDDAIRMFGLPEKIGIFKEEDILINIGPFGPYLKCGKTNVSVRGRDIFSIEEKEAIELIEEKIEADANANINFFEDSGIKVLNGRFGPYITNGKVNAKIPKDIEPKDLDEETCIEMIKNAPKKKFRRKFRARKK
ncbi:MAG: type I DNA topoisomerase [Gammaproteobacteria bacterium]|jgi:DNA topoisomerase I|nr:type I DNA topoisomerase [Gammaproteobacteria bacterium]MBT4462269.1 type I DNA topoisomerase [Gammaproteobacteria bacterium]MBT4655196.1 type I DNA topoisomerase [Gammaproteobacteria bacterium]MBT5116979.1 type I DNA topoisomerase [Gammaproteobacteria bacterium]MBT5762013.1 type I DNA topoisomerase [Gammaproteobacteria bacterium]